MRYGFCRLGGQYKLPFSRPAPFQPTPQGLVRAYTKKVGERPDFDEPVVLSDDRGGVTVSDFCAHIHKSLLADFKYALVWGTSTKHMPQRCAGWVLLRSASSRID